MPIKKRAPAPIGPIDPEVLDFMLTGTCPIDSFMEFDRSFEQWIDYWRQHEGLLRAEARRRGLRGVWIIEHYPLSSLPRRTGPA